MVNHEDAHRLAEQALGLRAFAASLAHGQDHDDLVQQTALTALESPRSHDARTPWLRRVLRNHARQRHRSTQRRLRRDATLVAEPRVDIDEQALFRAQLLATLGQALAQLDEPYRHTMRERFLQGRSAAEIARRTDTPATTVRSRIQHALDELRHTLDDRFGGRSSWCPALMMAVDLPVLDVATPAAGASASTKGAMMIKTLGIVGATAVASAALAWGSADPEPSGDSAAAQAAAATNAAEEPGRAATMISPHTDQTQRPASGDSPSNTGSTDTTTDDATYEHPIPGAWAQAKRRLEATDQTPMLLTLHGGAADDYDRAERLGLFAVCEDMVLPVESPKIVAFEVEWQGHETTHMALIRDDIGRPEVIACVRAAFDEIDEAKKLEYPDYDGSGWNIAGAIFGGEPRPPLPDHVVPEQLPLVTEGVPRRGADDAAMTMVVCGDYDSKFTRRTATTIGDLQTHFGPKLRVVWLQGPLIKGSASLRARAATVAHGQGLFWEMHAKLMETESEVDVPTVVSLAEEVGLDPVEFRAALDAPQTTTEVQRQLDTCRAHEARATPFFFIGDEKIAGAVPFDRLADSIEAALAAEG